VVRTRWGREQGRPRMFGRRKEGRQKVGKAEKAISGSSESTEGTTLISLGQGGPDKLRVKKNQGKRKKERYTYKETGGEVAYPIQKRGVDEENFSKKVDAACSRV